MAETLYSHRSQISMAEETTAGSTETSPAHYPGHAMSIDLPDESVEWRTYKAIGAGRDWNAIVEGPHSFEGSVDLVLLKADILFYAFGQESCAGAITGGGGSSTLNGATAIGATSVTVVSGTNFTTNDYMAIDVGALMEIRKVTAHASSPEFTVEPPLRLTHASGVAVVEHETPWVHTLAVNTGNKIPSFTLEAALSGAATAANVRRKFNGCHINTMELSCEEEGELHANIGIIGMNTTAADTTVTTVSIPTTVPYMFDEGVINLFGGVLATVKSIKVNINNNMKANRYIQATSGLNPDEIVTGNRTIEIQCTAVIQDKTFTEKMRPAGQTATTLSAKFSRSATDYIDIQATGVFMTECSQPIPEEGEIVADMTLVAKTCVIETTDATPYYYMV